MILRPLMADHLDSRKPRASGDDPSIEAPPDADVYVNPARAGMIPNRFFKR